MLNNTKVHKLVVHKLVNHDIFSITRIKTALTEREIVEEMPDGTFRLADHVFQKWFTKEWM